MVGSWCRMTALDGSYRKVVFVKEFGQGKYRVMEGKWDDGFVESRAIIEAFRGGLDFCFVAKVQPMEQSFAVLVPEPTVHATSSCFLGNWARMPLVGEVVIDRKRVVQKLVAFGEEQMIGEGDVEIEVGLSLSLKVIEESRAIDFPVVVEHCKAVGKRWRTVFRADNLIRVHKMYWIKLSKVDAS